MKNMLGYCLCGLKLQKLMQNTALFISALKYHTGIIVYSSKTYMYCHFNFLSSVSVQLWLLYSQTPKYLSL